MTTILFAFIVAFALSLVLTQLLGLACIIIAGLFSNEALAVFMLHLV